MSTLRNIKRYQQAVRQNNGVLQTDQLELVTKADDPTDANLTNGRMYYKTGTGFRAYAEGSWFTIPTSTSGGSGSSWDTLYLADKACTIDDTTLTWAGTHASNDVLTITNATGSGSCLQITNSGTGDDIQGTSDTWAVTAAGAAVFTAVTGCDTLTAAANLSIDATSTGTIGIGETSTGTVTITPALVAVASVTITGSADADKFVITAGDAKISAGQLTIIEDDTATFALNITSAGTTGGAIHATCNDLADGFMVTLDSDNEASFGTGGYFNCFDGAATVFSILANGAVTIAGHAGGTDALTITAGDIFLSDSDQNIIESENGTSTLLLLDNKAGAVGSAEAVLKVDAGGVVNAGGFGIYATFTGAAAAGATVVGVVPDAGSLGIFVNGGGVDTREALKIDADPTAYDVALINSDGVIAADKGALQIVTTGAIAAGGTAMRFDITGTPDADARVLEFDLAGVTDTHEPYGIFLDAGGKHVRALHIDADPVVNDVVYIHSDAVIADDKALLSLHSAGAIASGGNVFRIVTAGTPDVASIAFEMDVQDDCQAFKLDTDSATADAFYITHSGNLGAGKAVMHVTDAGTPGQDNSYVGHFAFTGTATNESVVLFADGGGKDVTGLYVDSDCVYAADNLSAQITLFSDAAGDLPILMQFYHSDAGAVDGEYCAKINFFGSDDAPAKELYASIEVEQDDTTAANPDGILWIKGDLAGTNTVSAGFTGNKILVGAAASTITTAGDWDLTISTNKTGAGEPNIVMTDGSAGDITITPGTTGLINLVGSAPTNTAVTAAHTMTVAEGGFVTCTSAAPYAITLPAVSGLAGLWYTFKKTDAAANAITLTGNGAETIDGGNTNATIDAQYDTISIYCDGAKWNIFSEDLA